MVLGLAGTARGPWRRVYWAAGLPGASRFAREVSRAGPGPPAPSPSALMRDYLAAMEARDLARARRYLADDFTMVFPGGVRFRTPEELANWAAERYRAIARSYQGFDEMPGDDGTIVYSFGTLSGEWPDGTAFSGIRFIDRFTVVGQKLKSQEVWNDLAAHRSAPGEPA